MSLTSLIKSNSEESMEFKDIINSIEINPMDFETKIHSVNTAEYFLKDYRDAALVGTAFDYLARFHLKRCEYILKEEYFEDIYVAFSGLNIISSIDKAIYSSNLKIYNAGLEVIKSYVKSIDEPQEQLLKRLVGVSVFFSKLEKIARGDTSNATLNTLKYRITADVEKDLYNLFEIFKESFEKEFNISTKNNKIIYNPTFKKCSRAVGGADADVIINDTLIDFKTTKGQDLTEEQLYQLVGYFLFSKVENLYDIKKVAIYYSRYGKFITYDFNSISKKKLKLAKRDTKLFIDKLSVF